MFFYSHHTDERDEDKINHTIQTMCIRLIVLIQRFEMEIKKIFIIR